VRDVLQHHGLAGLRRRDDETALALADRRAQVDRAGRDVLGRAVADLELEALVGEERREILEENLGLGRFGPVEVDVVDLEQGELALAVLRRTDLAGDGVAGAKPEAADLAGGDIDVVRTGQV
jgi:hypothetical protein